jgi:hypothetical protein
MSSFDRKFEVVAPDLTLLFRKALPLSDRGLVNPVGSSPVPLMDGEFVQINAAYKWVRAASTTIPSYAVIEERGDFGVQGSGKLSVLFAGSYEADTVIFDAGATTLGEGLMNGNVTIAGATRRGLAPVGGGGLVIGYVTRVAASNGGRLRFHQTLV